MTFKEHRQKELLEAIEQHRANGDTLEHFIALAAADQNEMEFIRQNWEPKPAAVKPSVTSSFARLEVLNYIQGVGRSKEHLTVETPLRKAMTFNKRKGSPLTDEEINTHIKYYFMVRAHEAQVSFNRNRHRLGL